MDVQIQSSTPPLIFLGEVPAEQKKVATPNQNPSATEVGGEKKGESDESVKKSESNDKSSLMFPPGSDIVKPIIEKINSGKPLNDEERKKLFDWFNEQQRFNNSIHILTMQTPSEKPIASAQELSGRRLVPEWAMNCNQPAIS